MSDFASRNRQIRDKTLRPETVKGSPETLIAPPERLVAEFESALGRGENPHIEDHLPPTAEDRRTVLAQLVVLESKFRLKSGEPVRVEDYQTRFPELATDAGTVEALRRTVRQYDPISVVGEVLEQRYRVTHCIGGGGMGYVYAARDLRFDRAGSTMGQVAIKFMRHTTLSEDGFKREAHLMRQFRHNNFVEVYDYGVTEDGLAWLVMEYLPGSTLEQLLERHDQRLPLDLILKFIREVGTALNSAHSRNLVHRDLKPANIILAFEDRPSDTCFKVLDFGLSTCIDAKGTLQNESMKSAGTPSYMSPEQVTGWPVTQHADIYSLGVILFQLFTGHLPIDNSNARMACYHHVHTPPKRFHEVAPDLDYPDDVEKIILQCLEKGPENRPVCVADIQERLLSALQPPPPSVPVPPQKGAWKIGAASALAAAVCVAILATTWKPPPAVPTPQDNPSVVPARPPPNGPPEITVAVALPSELDLPAGREVRIPIQWEWSSAAFPQGEAAGDQVRLRFAQDSADEGIPDGAVVEIQAGTWDGGAVELAQTDPPEAGRRSGAGVLTVRARSDAPAMKSVISVTAIVRQGDTILKGHDIMVPARVVWLPDGFDPAPEPSVRIAGGEYLYNGMERIVGGERVEFVLIPDLDGRPLKPFYIMRDKVWRSLFLRFLDTKPQSISAERQSEIRASYAMDAGSLRWPANNVKVEEAFHFARWLGGAEANLPGLAEWNRASGYEFYDANHAFNAHVPECWKPDLFPDGPYRGTFENAKKLAGGTGFRDVGSVPGQESCYGCRDLGSNGLEFLNEVRHNLQPGFRVPLPEAGRNDTVQVRGMAASFAPLKYQDVKAKPQLYDKPDYNISFRVVVTP